LACNTKALSHGKPHKTLTTSQFTQHTKFTKNLQNSPKHKLMVYLPLNLIKSLQQLLVEPFSTLTLLKLVKPCTKLLTITHNSPQLMKNSTQLPQFFNFPSSLLLLGLLGRFFFN